MPVVRPVLIYGGETLKNAHEMELYVAEVGMVRWMFGVA